MRSGSCPTVLWSISITPWITTLHFHISNYTLIIQDFAHLWRLPPPKCFWLSVEICKLKSARNTAEFYSIVCDMHLKMKRLFLIIIDIFSPGSPRECIHLAGKVVPSSWWELSGRNCKQTSRELQKASVNWTAKFKTRELDFPSPSEDIWLGLEEEERAFSLIIPWPRGLGFIGCHALRGHVVTDHAAWFPISCVQICKLGPVAATCQGETWRCTLLLCLHLPGGETQAP